MISIHKIQSLPPVVSALAIQFVVYLSLLFAQPIFEQILGYMLPLFWAMVIQGIGAAILTYSVRLSNWWVGIQFAAPPLLVFAMLLELPLWVFPVLFVVLLMIFWNVAVNRVPLYLTNSATADRLADLLPKKQTLKVVDLGSGLGGTMRTLAHKQQHHQFYGYESAPVPFFLSWLLTKLGGHKNANFFLRSFWSADLSDYDVLYCFLSPVPMSELYKKAKKEMKPGSLFISNSFTVPNHKPNRTVTVKDGRKTKLMIWKI